MDPEPCGLIVTFESSHMAIRAERALKARGLGPDLIPVPREISSACGFCLSLPSAALGGGGLEAVRALSSPGREALWSVWELPGTGRRKERRYERID